MAVMGYLRERMGKIVAFVIGLSLFAFIVSEVISSGGSFFRDDANELGAVNGEKIAYDEFNNNVEQSSLQFKQQTGTLSPQITAYVQENTWNMMLSRKLIEKEVEKLGLIVGNDETQAMTTGNNPSPQIVQAFTDPQTGQFSRANLVSTIQNINGLKNDDPQKLKWKEFVVGLIEARLGEKYLSMVTNGLYVNSLEAKDDYEAKNKLANFKYTTLQYASIPDSKVTLTDGDFSDYYDEHKSAFKNKQELRDIEYVTFNAAPAKEDSIAVREQVAKLIPALQASTNDSLFVQINSETKTPLAYTTKGRLDPKLDSVMFNAAPGFIYGPFLSKGKYTIAKLVASRIGPDSVQAKHILLSPPVDGGVDKALAKADSLKKIIQSGKSSFDDMARMYSVDKASAEKGGDLGTFGRGAMIPAFEDPVFSGSTGQLIIVNTQYGVHLIQIGTQKGSSRAVKVAVVDKPLTASSKTQSTAYSKAQAFLSSVTGADFDAKANKGGLKKTPAESLTSIASVLPGMESSARDLVRWAYKAEKGDVSDQVFTIGDQYVVAHLTQVKPKGILPLEAVKKQIEPAVRNAVKAKQLTEKITTALSGASNIDQVAQKIGGAVTPIQNIVFANPILPGVATEYKLIGTIFGSKVNKLSKPVEGESGVYVYVVDGFTNPAPLTNTVIQRQQIAQSIMQRAQTQVFEALKDKANVKDNRSKFL